MPPLCESQSYRVYLPKNMLRIQYLVEGCLGGASNRTNLLVHFAHRNAPDTIVILVEGKRTYHRIPHCDMFVSHKALNNRNLTMTLCRRGEERKQHLLAKEEAQTGVEADFTAYWIPLAPVTSFRCLGRFLLFETTTGHQWSATCGRHGGSGRGWHGS